MISMRPGFTGFFTFPSGNSLQAPCATIAPLNRPPDQGPAAPAARSPGQAATTPTVAPAPPPPAPPSGWAGAPAQPAGPGRAGGAGGAGAASCRATTSMLALLRQAFSKGLGPYEVDAH